MVLSSFLLAIQGAMSEGLLWGIMALGVFITFRILDFPDMTVDGSFALGGSVSAVLISNGWNPFLTIVAATLAGMAAGSITGLLHTKLKIPGILSGILLMLALYSINLRVMSGPNLTLLNADTVITILMRYIPLQQQWVVMILGLVFIVVVIAVLYWFFGTELGCSLRATGDNEFMVRALGEDTDKMKILGLVIANGLVALSGSLVGQSNGYADVSMGIGAIVMGLASIVIGEVVMGHRFNFAYKLLAIVIGSVLYRVIIAVVLQLGLEAGDLKLITAIIVAIALSVPVINKKIRGR